MKKRFFSLIILALSLFCFCFGTYAAEEENAQENNNGQPKLILTDYSLSTSKLKPNESAVLYIKVKNVSKTQNAENVIITFSCDGVFADEVSSKYIEKIEKGQTITEQFQIKASKQAESGFVSAAISGEFENSGGQSFSFSNNITLEIESENKTETKLIGATKLMVTEYNTEKGYVSPDEKTYLSVTIKNMSKTSAAKNIKLILSDESGEICSESLGTAYLETLAANKSYEWKQNIIAANTAAVGSHKLIVTAEYEDESGAAYSSTDTLNVDVRQSAKLDFDGAVLNSKSYQGETQSVTLNLMNTGKSTLYNCKIDFDIEGIESGGCVYVGEIAAGESKSGIGNLRVSDELLGKTEGKIIITYEDSFGEQYEQTAKVSTTIQKKSETAETEDEDEKKSNLWWLFLLIGIFSGSGIGFGITWFINDKKQRKEDDLRL